MWKFLCLIFACVAVSNAAIRTVTLTSGEIYTGTNASGVILKEYSGKKEIVWQKKFDNLTVYFMQIYDDTGLMETHKMDNLCQQYDKKSFSNSMKTFILNKLANTSNCPIKERTVRIRLPITYTFSTSTHALNCGPITSMVNIVDNNNRIGSGKPSVLLNIWYRGYIEGDIWCQNFKYIVQEYDDYVERDDILSYLKSLGHHIKF